MQGSWQKAYSIPPKTYTCAHPGCLQTVTSGEGWTFLKDDQYDLWFLYICPQCLKPTFFDHYLTQIPALGAD